MSSATLDATAIATEPRTIQATVGAWTIVGILKK